MYRDKTPGNSHVVPNLVSAASGLALVRGLFNAGGQGIVPTQPAFPPVHVPLNSPALAPEARPTHVHWSGLTDRGRVRANNEDVFAAFMFDGRHTHFLGRAGRGSLAGGDFVFAVSDGMGGAKLGEFASRTAIDQIARLLPRSFRLSARGMNSGFHDILAEAVDSAHREIIRLGWAYEECWGMGATLSLAWLTPAWMYFAHVGDSRIYHFPRGGALAQVTHDHNQAGWMRRQGQLNEREARAHPSRHSLQQSLGAGNQFLDPHIGAVAHHPGDRFLICSDGLIDGLWDHHLTDLLGSALPLPELTRQMVERSLENSGRDNTTAVVIEMQDETGDTGAPAAG